MHIAMQTADRRLTPRRLVPRRQAAHPRANDPHKTAAYLEEVFNTANAPIFDVGDLLTFRKANGTVGSIMILNMEGEEVSAVFYDGMPHLFQCSIEDVASLRVVRIEELSAETVAMYRDLVGLVLEPAYTN